MAAQVLPWIQATELIVGKNHPTLPDVENRPLQTLLTLLGLDPNAAFPGLTPVFNARAHGILGDNATDNTAALASLITALPATGGTILFNGPFILGDAATYIIDTATLSKPNITFKGFGNAIIKKKATTKTHILVDHAAAADGFSAYGLTFDMNSASGFAVYTESNSAVSCNRTRNLKFIDCTFQNGVEEGLRLAKCQYVTVRGCKFVNLKDNGVEFLATDGTDGYFTGVRANQDAIVLNVSGCHFEDIKDGYYGAVNGCGVAIGAGVKTVSDVVVSTNTFLRCSRGMWAETNHATIPTRTIKFDNNVLTQIEYAGIGLVSCLAGTVKNNTLIDLGIWTAGDPAPPDPTALGFSPISDNGGIYCSGTVTNPSTDCVFESNTLIETRTGGAQKWMYGFHLNVGSNCSVKGNKIKGMKTKDYMSPDWTKFTGSVVPSPRPTVSVKASATQSLATASLVAMNYDVERWDSLAFHDNVTNNTRLTFPVPGRYRIRGTVSFTNNATGYRMLRINKNGATTVGEDTRMAVNGDDSTLNIACEVDVRAADTPLGTAADYVELLAYHTAGVNVTMKTNDERCSFSAELIDGSS